MSTNFSSRDVRADSEPIAIVGIGCRFPGEASSVKRYWSLLIDEGDALIDVPADRWSMEKFYDPDLAAGKSRVRRGGFLSEPVDEFDASFFGISPREADYIDPQQRLLLEAAFESIEDAGIPVERLAGRVAGVFIGGFTLDYSQLQFAAADRHRSMLHGHTATGVVMTMLANRISHAFDLLGPSMSVDTACSSSLVAVHLACQSIWQGESELAFAGGVNLMLSPNFTITASQGGFLSPTSRSRAFHAEADGYVRGEGCGVVVLKPLRQASADGDRIYAVIRGTAVGQDGHTNGITVPNGKSQERAMRAALRSACIDPETVSFVEAHGTGTPVGDPIEANAIGNVYGVGRGEQRRCLIASVKTNIGHLEAAAGVAGLIKAALVLQHGQVPAHLHLTTINPRIDLPALGLDIPRTLVPLPAAGPLARVAVNSFGFGGTNAHVVLEAAPTPTPPPTAAPMPGLGTVIPLSARSIPSLARVASRLADLIDGGIDPDQVGGALVRRRSQHTHTRAAVVADDPANAQAALRALAVGQPHERLLTTTTVSSARSKLAFVFTGMGPQWWGMGRSLLTGNPVFRDAIERCDTLFTPLAGWSILEELGRDETTSRMAETQVSQPANAALQIGLFELWRALGIEPDAIVGHSAGEVAAAYASGALSLSDAMTVVYHRARLQQRTSGQGRLLAVGLSPEQAAALVPVLAGRLTLAASNGPSAAALVGPEPELLALQHQLQSREVFARLVDGDVPYHGPAMDPLETDLRSCLHGLRPREPHIPMYSTVTGQKLHELAHDAGYWWRNVRQPVLFVDAARALIADGHTVFVELGPNAVLGSAISETLRAARVSGVSVPSLRRKLPDSESMATACAQLYLHGHSPDWPALLPDDGAKLELPTYSWNRDRYWIEDERSRADRIGTLAHSLLGVRAGEATPVWHRVLDGSRPAYLADHHVHGANLYPGAAFVDMAMAAAREEGPAGHYRLQDIIFHAPVALGVSTLTELQTTLIRETGSVEISGRLTPQTPWVRQMSATVTNARGVLAYHGLAAARDRCLDERTVDECYAIFRTGGFDYGPRFRTIAGLWLGADEAVARLDRTALGEADRFGRVDAVLDPVLLDGCFQLLLPLAERRGIPLSSVIPMGVERIEHHQDVKELAGCGVIWAHAQLTRTEDDLVVGDIVATDEHGRVLVEVRGFQVRVLSGDGSVSRQGRHWLYELSWEPQAGTTTEPLSSVAAHDSIAEPTSSGTWIVLADRDGKIAARLREQLGYTGDKIIVIHWPGFDFGEAAGTDTTPVVLVPPDAVVSVDVRGGGPATRDTAALDPRHPAPRVGAITLTGGSAFGLAAAGSVLEWLAEHRPEATTVVPAAALFDLGRGGDFHARPHAELGAEAVRAATDGPVAQGNVGAGTGAVSAEMKGGVGTASTVLPDGTVVAALAVLNSHHPAVDPASGLPYGYSLGATARGDAAWQEFALAAPGEAARVAARERLAASTRDRDTRTPLNTVIGVVATTASLDPGAAYRFAGAGQDGLAVAVRPAHGVADGDTVFAVATGATSAGATPELFAAASNAFARAIVHAVLAAESVTTDSGHIAAYRELYPGIG
ncbi:beta-ketoacyl synthase N-terminal-like domain-containing protein [Amycolatopsis sp. NPDC051102]|uniref:beta-ketoacyl synthase N-terminal-like domain-containing protein n=1 Tax=Amycolatopsis sp. NPDC051102 TaxID=3155163 RepID=UPI0034323C2B